MMSAQGVSGLISRRLAAPRGWGCGAMCTAGSLGPGTMLGIQQGLHKCVFLAEFDNSVWCGRKLGHRCALGGGKCAHEQGTQ